MKPSVGRIVHYVSYGTPGGEFASECRAAIIAAVPTAIWEGDAQPVDLVVLNPTGMFFNQRCAYHVGDVGHDQSGQEIEARSYPGGTWHWPERVDGA
jgi:hypothetical protein